jgi:hypothetical protein
MALSRVVSAASRKYVSFAFCHFCLASICAYEQLVAHDALAPVFAASEQ